MMKLNKAISVILSISLLAACHPNASNNVYSQSSLNTASRTIEAKVVNKRLVTVQGSSGLGAGAGAALGGVGGSAIGGGARSNIAGAVVGAVAGGVAGAVIEQSATQQQAYEYILKSDVTGLLTIIQSDGDINVGDNVFVILNSKPVIVKAGYK